MSATSHGAQPSRASPLLFSLDSPEREKPCCNGAGSGYKTRPLALLGWSWGRDQMISTDAFCATYTR